MRSVAALTIALGMAMSTLAAAGEGAFATGRYRNLFAEAGHTQAEVDAKIARPGPSSSRVTRTRSGSTSRAA